MPGPIWMTVMFGCTGKRRYRISIDAAIRFSYVKKFGCTRLEMEGHHTHFVGDSGTPYATRRAKLVARAADGGGAGAAGGGRGGRSAARVDAADRPSMPPPTAPAPPPLRARVRPRFPGV